MCMQAILVFPIHSRLIQWKKTTSCAPTRRKQRAMLRTPSKEQANAANYTAGHALSYTTSVRQSSIDLEVVILVPFQCPPCWMARNSPPTVAAPSMQAAWSIESMHFQVFSMATKDNVEWCAAQAHEVLAANSKLSTNAGVHVSEMWYASDQKSAMYEVLEATQEFLKQRNEAGLTKELSDSRVCRS